MIRANACAPEFKELEYKPKSPHSGGGVVMLYRTTASADPEERRLVPGSSRKRMWVKAGRERRL